MKEKLVLKTMYICQTCCRKTEICSVFHIVYLFFSTFYSHTQFCSSHIRRKYGINMLMYLKISYM